MKIRSYISYLEEIAPSALQEAYDNSGLITGNPEWECTGALIALDATEDVVLDAIDKKCNLIIAHHPILFKGLKSLTGKSYVERTIIKAIKNDIAIYAIHTNLDNILKGVNNAIAEKIGLKDLAVLQQREQQLKKIITFVPVDHLETVRSALFRAGGGSIGKYSECSFLQEGTSTFKPGEGADPFIGEIGKRHEEKEIKLEVIFPSYIQATLIAAMIKAHPYEEVAYDIVSLGNYLSDVGSGLIGTLSEPVEGTAFLETLKKQFDLKVIRHTPLINRQIKTVAVCGGSGSFLLPLAIKAEADIFITSDVKYHEFFDADGSILLADIGHYESEQFTIGLLYDMIMQKFPTFAVQKTGVKTNPVNYFL